MKNVLLSAAMVLTWAASARAQLRPLDPVDFGAFTNAPVHFEIGVATYADQRAALAGTEGRLWELGNFRLSIRTGRTILEFGGTVQRLFREDARFAEPYGDAGLASNGHRHDAGDYRAAAIVRLTPALAATTATLRFGTRLPTTDNRVGLDRDATDFFATLAAAHTVGSLSFAAESGISINGTRKTTYEQADVLSYGVTAQLARGMLQPYIMMLGQEDFHRTAIRGNEDLGELRVGLRAGRRRWINTAWVHGYRDYSPSNGWQLSGGVLWGR